MGEAGSGRHVGQDALFSAQFQAQVEESGPQEHEQAENDHPAAEPVEDGSNVVAVDFSRKK